MYDLPYFKESDENTILNFIAEHPFALLTGSYKNGKPVVTQIPVFIEDNNGEKVLRGHFMKNTDHHKAFSENPNVLVVFTGPHSYVSATWYDNPHQASTWNYMSVHVHGMLKFPDESGLIDVLRKTTLHFEKNNKTSSTIYDNLSTEYTGKLIKAITAFEIEITSIENVFKLSQNRDPKSYNNIIEELKKRDHNAVQIAEEMERRKRDLFPENEKWDPGKFLS